VFEQPNQRSITEFEDVVNEVTDSSSSDDDDELYIAAAHIVVSDIVNPACHCGS
jgi:hypothetical protein